MSRRSHNKNLDSFLNAKKTIELPSNLLTLKRNSPPKDESPIHRPSKMVNNQARFPKAVETPTYIEEKNSNDDKSVLYKRLSNIRGDNRQLGGLSFSKMLSRMVVMGDEELDTPHSSLEHRGRHTSYVRPVEQKLFNLNYKRTDNPMSRSIDVSSIEKPSRKLFKKYYLPNSEAAQTIFLENYNRHDKYIYKEGKRVECKRIHNFYTSHMFRKGYDKCFRKTTDTFRLTQ